jgi:FAD/FMN-containing dehydrogenase
MIAITKDTAVLDQAALVGLRAAVRGAVLLPGDPDYDAARSIWNGMIDRHPALIVRALGVGDIQATVNFARNQGLPLTLKGGGHNISGLAVSDGALLLDMSLMRGVWVDPDKRVAHAQPGCLLGDIDRETQLYGLAAVLGFISQTGAAGLTLGGGFGYLTRKYGWTCDNVLSFQMVTADGRLVHASADENPDLLWGLCGGGGNFGVVTDIEYKLYPVGPQIMAGALAWEWKDAPAVLDIFREMVHAVPPEMTIVAALRLAAPAPWLPKEIHGKLAALILVCHTGSLEDGARDVAALKAFGSPVGDIIQPRPYTSQQSILDPTAPPGRRNYWKSDYVGGFEPGLANMFINHAEKIASPFSSMAYFPLDGKLNEYPVDHSAVGNRDTAAVVNFIGSWENPAEDEKQISWARDAFDDLQPFSTGGTYINFLTEEEGGDRIQAAYGSNYKRLVEIKRGWDPENMFRMNKNIVP